MRPSLVACLTVLAVTAVAAFLAAGQNAARAATLTRAGACFARETSNL